MNPAELLRCMHELASLTLSIHGYAVKISITTLAICTIVSSSLAAQTPRLAAVPARPEPGAIVRLTLSVPASRADSIVSVRGEMADEPLHFMPATDGTWHAIGGVPVNVEGRLVASATVHRASGKTESTEVHFTLPKLPPPVAQPLNVDSTFTRPLDSATIARIDRENARAREIGRLAHNRPPMWTASFLKPRTSVITSEFGSGRLFNGQVTARHLGVAFRGAAGEPGGAGSRGVVAPADDSLLAGT